MTRARSQTVGDALDLYEAGELESALRVLLSRWCDVRADALAKLIAMLSAKVSPKRDIEGRTRRERAALSDSLAEDPDMLDVPRLMRSFTDASCRVATGSRSSKRNTGKAAERPPSTTTSRR